MSKAMKSKFWLVALCATFMTSAAATQVAAQECDRSTPGFCTRTTSAAFRACRADVREELWLGIANCRNDSEDSVGCHEELKEEEIPELREECIDQCNARQDVCEGLGQGRYDPEIDPANFVDPADMVPACGRW